MLAWPVPSGYDSQANEWNGYSKYVNPDGGMAHVSSTYYTFSKLFIFVFKFGGGFVDLPCGLLIFVFYFKVSSSLWGETGF